MQGRHIVKLWWLSLVVLVFDVACSVAAPAAARPNIVFVLVDDLRFDALGCSGHPFVKTPNIDRIRNEGALFKNAFVTTSLCSPSRGSFLTGTYAHVHGVLGQDRVPGLANQYRVSDPDWSKTPSFAQLLQRAGYE